MGLISMKRWQLLCTCSCLLTTGAGATVGDRGDTAAASAVAIRVGDTRVTAGEFSDRLNFIPHPGEYGDGDDQKRALAASIVAEKILADQAHRIHLDTLPEARAVIRQAEKEAVYEQWMDQEVVSKTPVSEKALRDAFQRFRQQRTVDFAVFSDSSSAASARRAIEHGQSFAQATVIEPNGQVERKTLEYAEALPVVEDAVYGLHPGEVSRVISVDMKYYLFRLVSVQSHPTYANGSFSHWRPALERRVKSRLVDRKLNQALSVILRDKSYEINKGLYDYVADAMARRLPFHNPEMLRTPELINRELAQLPPGIEGRLADPFVHFSDGTVWSVGDVWSKLRYGPYLLNYRSEQELKAGLKDVLRNMVVFETVVERGYRQGLEKTPHVKKEARMWHDDLLSRLFQAKIEDTIQVRDEEMIRWYNAHRRDFLRPEMREIQEIVLEDRSLAELLIDSLKNGAEMTELARYYPSRGGLSLDSTGIHWIVKDSRGELGHIVFYLKPGDLYGPIAIDSTRFAIIRLLKIQSETPRPFAEVKEQIHFRIKEKKTSDILNTLLEQRASDYSVSVHQDVLSGIDVLEGGLMVRKSHFPNRFAVPLATPFASDAHWFQRILDGKLH